MKIAKKHQNNNCTVIIENAVYNTSVGVLGAMPLALRHLEDIMACPWPWP